VGTLQILKGAIKHLGAIKTEKLIFRILKARGQIVDRIVDRIVQSRSKFSTREKQLILLFTEYFYKYSEKNNI